MQVELVDPSLEEATHLHQYYRIRNRRVSNKQRVDLTKKKDWNYNLTLSRKIELVVSVQSLHLELIQEAVQPGLRASG